MKQSTFLRRVGVTLVVAAMLSSCSTIATHEEYSSYRAVRTANSERDSLIAMQQYVEHHPGGYWITEVQASRQEREEGLWSNSNTTREGLEWYLRVYPDGAFVDQARPRLAALQTVSSRRQQETQRQDELEAQQRAALAEQRRTWVSRAVQFWTGTMIGIGNYGQPIQRVVAANQDFSAAFGQAPQPTCTAEYCIKHYGQLFHIPVPGGTRIDRHLDVYLRIIVEGGRVERTELLLPNKGFSRWYEMENHTEVLDADPEQRMTAINWALDRIQPIVQQAASGASRIDFVPEPIAALEVHGESTEAAPTAPGQDAPAPEGAQKQDDGPAGEDDDSTIDDLLRDASGVQTPPVTPVAPADPPPPTADADDALVLPVNLISYRYRNLRVVVFAAGDEDYDQGYDGIFVERVRD